MEFTAHETSKERNLPLELITSYFKCTFVIFKFRVSSQRLEAIQKRSYTKNIYGSSQLRGENRFRRLYIPCITR